jgi:ATP-dependent exoDNAse (exonuclease V) alpha subunit
VSGEPLGRRSASLRNAGFDLTFTAPKSVSVLLAVGDDGGRQVHLAADYLAHAQHAYATTGIVSQGATVDHTFLLASPARGGREWAYVAGSRQRIDLGAYLTHYDPEPARVALAATWERSQVKHMALGRLPAQQAAAWLAHARARRPQGSASNPRRSP